MVKVRPCQLTWTGLLPREFSCPSLVHGQTRGWVFPSHLPPSFCFFHRFQHRIRHMSSIDTCISHFYSIRGRQSRAKLVYKEKMKIIIHISSLPKFMDIPVSTAGLGNRIPGTGSGSSLNSKLWAVPISQAENSRISQGLHSDSNSMICPPMILSACFPEILARNPVTCNFWTWSHTYS